MRLQPVGEEKKCSTAPGKSRALSSSGQRYTSGSGRHLVTLSREQHSALLPVSALETSQSDVFEEEEIENLLFFLMWIKQTEKMPILHPSLGA